MIYKHTITTVLVLALVVTFIIPVVVVRADNDASTTSDATATSTPRQKTFVERAQDAQKAFQARRREEQAANKEKFDESKKALRAKAEQIENLGKRNAFERVTEKIQNVNGNLVERYSLYIDRLELVLGKVEDRTLRVLERGADVTDVNTAIEAAHESIAKAREVVLEQDARVYNVSDDTTQEKLSGALRDLVKELSDDHKSIRDGALRDARDSIHNSVQVLKDSMKGLGNDADDDNATSGPTDDE